MRNISRCCCNVKGVLFDTFSCKFDTFQHKTNVDGKCRILTSSLLTSRNISTSDQYEKMRPLPSEMKGVVVESFGTIEELRLRSNLPLPTESLEKLERTQILVRVAYAGVNPVDTYIRSGVYARLPKLPYIPGSDASGYIEAIGADVCKTSYPIGSRVFVTGAGKGSGCYAEFVTVDMNYVFPLDQRLSFAQGAGLGVPYFTAYKAVVTGAKATNKERILVHGASGAVGTAATQIANSLGCEVFGTAGTQEGMDIVKRCGAHFVFNHRESDYTEKIKTATNGEGFDIIIENLANMNLDKDMQMLRKGARIMIVGSRGEITINPRYLMAPEASIKGVALGSTTDEQYREIGVAISGGIAAGWVNPIVDKEYDLDKTQRAHHDIVNSSGAKGNLVIKLF